MIKIIAGCYIAMILTVISLLIFVFLEDWYRDFRVKWAKKIGEKFNEIH